MRACVEIRELAPPLTLTLTLILILTLTLTASSDDTKKGKPVVAHNRVWEVIHNMYQKLVIGAEK